MVEYAAKIHAKHESIFTVWDTMEELNIRPVLVTSAQLSPEAKRFAKALRVDFKENYLLGDYPMIKCNVNRQTGELIYHMPYDQMYDRVVIEPEKGEFYAMTIDEAEQKGFRRAMRYSLKSA